MLHCTLINARKFLSKYPNEVHVNLSNKQFTVFVSTTADQLKPSSLSPASFRKYRASGFQTPMNVGKSRSGPEFLPWRWCYWLVSYELQTLHRFFGWNNEKLGEMLKGFQQLAELHEISRKSIKFISKWFYNFTY